MRAIAILEIDEEKLSESDENLENAMGWVEESGIRMVEYHELKKGL